MARPNSRRELKIDKKYIKPLLDDEAKFKRKLFIHAKDFESAEGYFNSTLDSAIEDTDRNGIGPGSLLAEYRLVRIYTLENKLGVDENSAEEF